MVQQSMQKFIIAIIMVGVTLVIGIFIAATIQDATEESTSASTINETGAYFNATGYTLNDAGTYTFTTISIIEAYNYTDGTLIAPANYTVSLAGVVTNTTVTTHNNVSISYAYTYEANTDTSDAAGDLVTALSGGSAWITILVVVGFATIVLGMLTQGLGRKEEELESGFIY